MSQTYPGTGIPHAPQVDARAFRETERRFSIGFGPCERWFALGLAVAALQLLVPQARLHPLWNVVGGLVLGALVLGVSRLREWLRHRRSGEGPTAAHLGVAATSKDADGNGHVWSTPTSSA